MRELTLSEQMGAMAVVDGLRHRQLQLNEHLNLPARREEATRGIREYYLQQNIEADDALIEKGVREFFSHRFTYLEPPLGFWSKALARAHLQRKVHSKRLLAVAISAALVAGVGLGVQKGYHHYQVNAVEREADKAALGVSELLTEISRQTDAVNGLAATHETGAVPDADAMVVTIKANLQKARELIRFTLPQEIDSSNYVDTRAKLESYQQDFYASKDLLWRNRESLPALTDIYSASDSIEQLTSSASFQQAVIRYPVLQGMADQAKDALENSRADGGHRAADASQKLRTAIGHIPNLDMLSSKGARALDSYKRIGLNSTDMTKVTATLEKANALIREMDYDSAKDLIEFVTGMIPFAEQPLTIEIVAKPKSAVERRYKAGGKAWFFLVQAKDAGGNVIRAPVNDSESGERAMAGIFGVQVSNDAYNRLKEDKADGHIEDVHIGDKPAKSLTIDWTSRTLSANPDTILNWREQ